MIDVLNLKNVNENITEPISFSVARDEIVGLIGSYGIGKTRICDMITGFIPCAGAVSFDGVNTSAAPTLSKGKVGYMPKNTSLYPEMSVWEFLQFAAKIRKVSADVVLSTVEGAVDFFQLIEIKDEIIGKLPKGMRKKISLAAATFGNPEILVLDEPFYGLSCEEKEFLAGIIKEIAVGKAVLITGTASNEIFDRIIDLGNEAMLGDLFETDETDELIDNQEIEAVLEEELLDDVTEVEDASDAEIEDEGDVL